MAEVSSVRRVTLDLGLPHDGDLMPPMPSEVKRSMSFTSCGNVEHIPLRPSLMRGKSCAAALSLMGVVEPPTPQRRGSTTDELSGLSSLCRPKHSQDAEEVQQMNLPQQQGPVDDSFFDFDDLPPVHRGFSSAHLAASPTASPPADKSPSRKLSDPEEQAVEAEVPDSWQPLPGMDFCDFMPSLRREAQRRPASEPPGRNSDGVRVGIIVNGTDGDMIPLLALAQCLTQQYHHIVRAFANANLIDLCVHHGIDAVPVYADTQAVFESLGGVSGTVQESANKGWTVCQAWLKANPGACVAAEDALQDFKPQALICCAGASAPAMRHEHSECVPVMQVFFQRETLEIFEDQLHLEPTRPQFFAMTTALDDNPLPKAHRLHRTSGWALDDTPPASLLEGNGRLAALRQFLADGPPPVAVGWGSMIVEGLAPGEMLALALGALRRAGRRGVVLGGWSRLHTLGERLVKSTDELAAFAAEKVCFVPSAPHSWLFPQCSCVVHHGGAGTTQAALRAGVPMVVTPVFADQFETSQAINRLGAGYGFEDALPSISEDQLRRALELAEECGPRARELSEQAQNEKGVKHAGAIVDTFLRKEVKSGQWARKARKIRQEASGWARQRS